MKLKVRPLAPEVRGCDCIYSRGKLDCKQRVNPCGEFQTSNMFFAGQICPKAGAANNTSRLINKCSTLLISESQYSIYSECTCIKCRWVSVIRKAGLHEDVKRLDVALITLFNFVM